MRGPWHVVPIQYRTARSASIEAEAGPGLLSAPYTIFGIVHSWSNTSVLIYSKNTALIAYMKF